MERNEQIPVCSREKPGNTGIVLGKHKTGRDLPWQWIHQYYHKILKISGRLPGCILEQKQI